VLDELRLQNFRGFDEHVVPLRQLTIIVGPNNAGKSTIVEALRLVALVVGRFVRGTGSFVAVPDWLEHPLAYSGIQPALRGRGFEGHGPSTFHSYGPPPAVITARFSNGASVDVFVGPDGEIHGVARDVDGNAVGTASQAKRLAITPIAIQPQVAPLLREEPIRNPETVRRGEGTHLAPQHFRNQLFLARDELDEFMEMAEQTWPGLQIRGLEGSEHHPERPLELHIRDGDFVGEVSLMGHGLQMWLQTIWFLARTPRETTVVLDEPDVYMHPDLQRRLLSLVRDRFDQLLIATHSVEIVADVDPAAILSINRAEQHSQFVTDVPGVQEVIDGLGGVHSIQVTRLVRTRYSLLVEGEDVRVLRILQRAVDPDAQPIDLLPPGELGGRGGWTSGVPARLPKRNLEGQKIISYCILDRDYFPEDEVEERYEEARRWKVNLHVWRRKELENYLLVPSAISRFISEHVGTNIAPPSLDEIADEIDEIVADLKDQITDRLATELFNRDKKGGPAKANKRARAIVAASWKTPERRCSLAPGKEVISKLSAWAQATYGVSFGPEQLARELRADEVPEEVVIVLKAIGAGRRFPKPGTGG
jgi:hypothetical protein